MKKVVGIIISTLLFGVACDTTDEPVSTPSSFQLNDRYYPDGLPESWSNPNPNNSSNPTNYPCTSGGLLGMCASYE